jgi:hypothetical protein
MLHGDASEANLHSIAETKTVRLSQMNANRHFRRRALCERAHAAASIKPTISHVLFVLAALVALTIQILVVQPHIHIAKVGGTSGVTLVASAADSLKGVAIGIVRTAETAATPSRDSYPINEDPSNCPLCQEIAYSSHFVQSAAILAVLLLDAPVRTFSLDEARPSFLAVSHIWHGRAPPTA